MVRSNKSSIQPILGRWPAQINTFNRVKVACQRSRWQGLPLPTTGLDVSSPAVAKTTASTHWTYPQGMARLSGPGLVGRQTRAVTHPGTNQTRRIHSLPMWSMSLWRCQNSQLPKPNSMALTNTNPYSCLRYYWQDSNCITAQSTSGG